MDDTQMNKTVDATATRKRRSSILKNQRPPRTPFSELEFNVATPTDTTKNRRVSFSKRTGVVEFETNEVSTAWKNFYEEHNRSLETSGNDDSVKAPRPPPISQLGRHIFDDQEFEEIETVDFCAAIRPTQSLPQEFQNSISNANFTDHLASLQCTTEKPILPQQRFELSELTDQQSKLFRNDLTIPTMAEMSNQMNVNFSLTQNKGDDLDEIQRDLARRAQQNIVGPTDFGLSEYIEIDINSTKIEISNDDNMSITDTIQSPKVQEISQALSKKNVANYSLDDKENILVNPYAPIRESDNFAIHEEVLVFDGKKLTIQKECKSKAEMPFTCDLPNFVSDSKPHSIITKDNNSIYNDENMPIPKEMPSRRKTIVFDDNMGDISTTQVVPGKVIEQRRRTIVFENDCDVSTTQAVPTNIIVDMVEKDKPSQLELCRNTTVYDNNCDISMTQAIPTNIVSALNNEALYTEPIKERRRTVIFDTDCDISTTQAIPANIITTTNGKFKTFEEKRTIVYDNDVDISTTQAIPTHIIDANTEAERRRTIVFDCDVSMTRAIPTNILDNKEQKERGGRRKTIVFDDDCNVSITQAIPALIYQDHAEPKIVLDNKNISIVQDNPPKPASNSTLNQHANDISITQAPPQNILPAKRQTIFNDNDISITQAIPTNNINIKNNIHDTKMDTSLTETLPPHVFPTQIDSQKHCPPVSADISTIEANPNQILPIMEDVLMHECQPTKEANQIKEIHNEDDHCPTAEEPSVFEAGVKLHPNLSLNKTDNQFENMHTSCNDRTAPGLLGSDINGINQSVDILQKNQYENIKQDLTNMSLKTPHTVSPCDKLEEVEGKKTCIKYEDLCHESTNQILVYQSADVNIKQESQQVNSESGVESNHSEKKASEESTIEYKDVTLKKSSEVLEKDIEIVPLVTDDTMEAKSVLRSISVTGSALSQTSSKFKKSILNELLDMSTASEECYEDKNHMAVIESPLIDNESVMDLVETSNIDDEAKSDPEVKSDDVFIIRKDSDEDEIKNLENATSVQEVDNKLPELEFREEDSVVDDLKNKLQSLKTAAKNRHYEQVVSPSEKEMDRSEFNDFNNSRKTKSFKNADDTRELLQMLSEFTDRPSLPPTIVEENDLSVMGEKIEQTQTEPRRISFAPNRRSVVLSKEDLLKNISMAHAALQRSRYFDESELDDATEVSDEVIEVDRTARRSLRISGDVVKALQFNDTNDDVSVELSPLKKTAFGETSYMKETREKAKVIPTYDVSDGIKELMSDLVKPMADVLPFEAGVLDKNTKKTPSTISTQIQANLVTSSQIDIDVEMHSNPESAFDVLQDKSLLNQIATLGGKALARVLNGSDSKPSQDELETNVKQSPRKSPRRRQSVPGGVLVFDHTNPLNNVLLSPRDYVNVHPYNPIKSSDTLNSEREQSAQFSATSSGEDRVEVERVSTQFNVNVKCIASGDAGVEIKPEPSESSVKSKPVSIDRSIEMKLNITETEINTDIAMKPNAELLEDNSSLTLVDDALARSTFDVDLDVPQSEEARSPVRVIYKMYQNGVLSEKVESDITSTDGDYETIESKPKKRSLSPNIGQKEVTPKPQSKMQRLSNSPEGGKSPQKRLTKTRNSPKKSITVQQLMAEFNVTEIDGNAISEEVNHAIEALSTDTDMYSVTSNASAKESVRSELMALGSDVSRVEWKNPCMSDQSSKNLIGECESSANVVAKIDMLPFMGSCDCEWDTSSGDVWSFLLLRARLRLTIRMEHSYLNASRSRVRADTPLVSVSVDSIHSTEKDPLVSLCLRFAMEAMRYECSRSCSKAGDVPSVLKRCANVSRIAVQWLKAMRDAMLRLAYQVDEDGYLTLKIANIPLRSVWEISLRIELIVEDAQETAWPRAGSVDVATIVADVDIDSETLRDLVSHVPHDWGHVPRTIWKLFKYLKNKRRDDEFYGLNFMNVKLNGI
ncbi:unnamed protein product [Leptosia nina]|uniref:Uncharacterized protein n=1 Tax=Leptosia nina TaxID=320188 RepID=A0AAV1K011_9NEOP